MLRELFVDCRVFFFLFFSVVRTTLVIHSRRGIVVAAAGPESSVPTSQGKKEEVVCESRCGAFAAGKRTGMAAGRVRKTTVFRLPPAAAGRSGQVDWHLLFCRLFRLRSRAAVVLVVLVVIAMLADDCDRRRRRFRRLLRHRSDPVFLEFVGPQKEFVAEFLAANLAKRFPC